MAHRCREQGPSTPSRIPLKNSRFLQYAGFERVLRKERSRNINELETKASPKTADQATKTHAHRVFNSIQEFRAAGISLNNGRF
jgi:hypothetical protein